METNQLEGLENLLKGRINGKIIKHEIIRLMAPGENFGSEMMRVDITVEDGSEEKVVHTVAKLMPENDAIQEIFNTQVTYKNELGFYAEVVPALQEFQREQGIGNVVDYFPEFLGGRISIKTDSDAVDKTAVILLENLKVKGYENMERMKGFDLETSRLVLRTLAIFQATAVALKLKKPEVFDSKIMSHLTEWKAPNPPVPVDCNSFLNENAECARLKSRLEKCLKKPRNKKIREPWASITHNDLWVNNVMVRHKKDVADSIKFVDFQVIDYGSVATDVIFFLFSSVNASVLKYHFSKLLKFYYDSFIESLKQLNIDTKKFTYESYQKELEAESTYQINHTLFMFFIIFGPKAAKPSESSNGVLKSSPSEPVAVNGDGHKGPPSLPEGHARKGPPPQMPPFKPPIEFKERLWFIVEEAARRKWI